MIKAKRIKNKIKSSIKKKKRKKSKKYFVSENSNLSVVKEPQFLLYSYVNKIIRGDCLEKMKLLPSESVDLIITSPPYNLKNSTGNGMSVNTKTGKWAGAALQKGYSHYDDNMPHEKYAKWQNDCLKEMFRLLKDDGAIFYNHKRRVQNGLIQDRDDILQGLPVRQIIIWKRSGGINFNPGYFLPTHEVIYLIPKPKFKLKPKANAYGDVWEFTQEMKNGHPAPFPVTLIDRIISSTTAEIVLDPFMGSGTTAIAALMNKRKYIGIELSPEYCNVAENRITTYLENQSYLLINS
ncbi:MAG: site-specific DNA-methyltransferase [Bacteroidetes bacterium]|nr:site-specific DNA-methyltransferase [Bacteroidota bacterium]